MHDSALGDSGISDYQESKGYYPIKHLSPSDERSFQLKRLFKPHKVYYELEHRDSWLQIDEHTSKGIERIRKLGFSNLDVRLDQSLSHYFSCDEVLIEINYLPFISKDIDTLLRLRRVHWWSKNYHLSIAALRNDVS
ncbi:hypothetical protein K501DRAFT_286940 [Backusella circina FSU 941]|nr:hypothetical protein K501DRAFT_286940 [Backusella circina FSU 941]